MKSYNVLGLMSGTSLDGLDMVFARFYQKDGWKYEIYHCVSIPYNTLMKRKLLDAINYSAIQLYELENELSAFWVQAIKSQKTFSNFKPDFVSMHGHTVFHQPQKGFTVQIGNANLISAELNLPVIYDFRSKDVAFGGQGAPLVPTGDYYLFSQFNSCVNLGGIANISFVQDTEIIAFDICPFNIIFNHLSEFIDKDFDEGGKIAEKGNCNIELYKALNEIDYYKQKSPKSLGIELINDTYLRIIQSFNITIEDKMRTYAEHCSEKISNSLKGSQALLSGGGAFNSFVVQLIKNKSKSRIIIPDKDIVNYKEALIFGFLGVLRWENEINVFKSVTGASKNTSCGTIVFPD